MRHLPRRATYSQENRVILGKAIVVVLATAAGFGVGYGLTSILEPVGSALNPDPVFLPLIHIRLTPLNAGLLGGGVLGMLALLSSFMSDSPFWIGGKRHVRVKC